MKHTFALLAALMLAPLAVPAATNSPAKPVEVSVAYTLGVRKELAGVANVHRPAANCGSTKTALGSYGLERWLAGENAKWDAIHFNHGLHDLSYRFADDKDKNAKDEYASPANGGHQNVPPVEYEQNLRKIVARLKQTGAKLIFATTTPVPEPGAAKYVKDSEMPYNEVARKVMAAEGISIDDLWAAVKPQLEKLQIPNNVHFQSAGSAVLARQVAQSIRAALPAGAASNDYDFTALIQPAPATAKFSDPDYYIWCGTMVRGDDGKCHLFYSRWPHKNGFNAWVTHSEVAHAVGDSPLGPFKHKDVALPERGKEFWDGHCTHNPTVLRFGHGQRRRPRAYEGFELGTSQQPAHWCGRGGFARWSVATLRQAAARTDARIH
ncbi:MAG: GDSL-type esterase/lipase family protein [Kiritimatiellaeota bacterium]|nr:GDSL-type esterase/lipase family protein [Kiritimatiellota bacterium]